MAKKKPPVPTIHERFKAARAAAELTQREVAEILGVPGSFIANIERGTKAPSLGWLHKAATALGWAPESLDDRLQATTGRESRSSVKTTL